MSGWRQSGMDMKSDSVQGVTARKLAQLLGLVLDDSDEADDITMHNRAARLLDQWLSEPLPPFPDTATVQRILTDEPPAEPETALGPPIGQILLDDQTDIKTIKGIKDCAKALSRRNRTEPLHAVAVTIYYAAIASALLFHGLKITSYSYEKITQSCEDLMTKPWMPQSLWDHFAKACQQARER